MLKAQNSYYEPGIHSNLDLNKAGFQRTEKHIIFQLKQVFFVTFARYQKFKGSDYTFAFLRPTQRIQESFRLEKEILVLNSKYSIFDSRNLDFVDKLMFEYRNRLDKLCLILVSNDKDICEKIKDLTIREPETRIIVPFHYDEFFNDNAQEVIWSRLKEQFYGRDLFSFESPLQSDTYFFGRNEYVHFYYDKYRTGENSGLFGLRKIGKTSVLYALERQLIMRDEFSILIDCQDPSLHKRRWNEALQYIVRKLLMKLKEFKDIDIDIESDYSEINASQSFAIDLKKIYEGIGKSRVLLIFDEIENLTFSLSPSKHWQSGEDFITFWQAIRSTYQANNYLFSFIICGVNPKIIETGEVNKIDNPIYRMITPKYLSFFGVEQVKEMVGTIGNYMGLKFDEEVYTYLTEDFGGHPFLIRQICSFIHNDLSKERPVSVSKYYYKSKRDVFYKRILDYIALIIQVLKSWYPKEYEILERVSLGEEYKHTNETDLIIQHLLGYNLIKQEGLELYIKIQAVSDYLRINTRIIKKTNNVEEKWKVISEQRNNAEVMLRKLVNMILRVNFGEIKGKYEFLKIVDSKSTRYERLSAVSLNEVFSGNQEIYLDDLKKFICKNWGAFDKVFIDKPLFDIYLSLINKHRVDAHAKDISDDEYQMVVIALRWLNEKLNGFFN